MLSGPSITARVVALARSKLERPSTPAGDPEAEGRLYAGLRTPVLWPAALALHGWLKARTEFFDGETLQAIGSGVQQVVIVGAGYDGRALRFRQPGVRFFEVDQPGTQDDKRRRVEEASGKAEGVVYIPHDLADGDLAGALSSAGHEAGRPSLFICEGLLLYLPISLTEELLRTIHGCSGPGSRVAVSGHEIDPQAGPVGRLRMAGQRLLLAAIGEPRRALFEAGELGEVLERTGWAPASERVRASGGRRGMLIAADRR